MQMREVIMHLLLKQPFFGYFAASVTPVETEDIATISVVTSNSARLLYNGEWFSGLNENEAVGAVLHELLHLVLMHPFRRGNRERNLWTVACDMAVNEHIDEKLLFQGAVTVKAISKETNDNLPPQKSAEYYYERISQYEDQFSFLEKNDAVNICLKSGGELRANKEIQADTSEINTSAFKSMMSELIETAHCEGEIPEGMEGFLGELYRSNEINWRNVLKRFLSGRGRTVSRKTYKRESKRHEGMPGNKRSVGIKALLALDESGSVSDKQVGIFFGELLSISKITDADLFVTEFDTDCTESVHIKSYIRRKKRVKNGGTDFRPIFRLADRERFPLLIIFTDGDGPAPSDTNQKVLWVLTKSGKVPADFGHCVRFEA